LLEAEGEGEAELSGAEEMLLEVADAPELKGFESFQGVANAALGEIHRERAQQLGQVYWLASEAEKEIETYRKAIEVQTKYAASALLVHPLRRAGNVARWAAFALAKIDAVEDAIVVLENGRTRDVRRRLGGDVDEATLSALPEDARKAYLAAVAKLASSPTGENSDQAARELQEVVSSVRALEGFESFATEVTFSQIATAADPDWPLVYVNPTPWGTALLSVHLVHPAFGAHCVPDRAARYGESSR